MQDITELMTEVIAALENGGIGDALRVIADGCYLKYLQFELGLEIEADGGPLDDINTFIEFSTDFTSPSDFIEYVEAAKVQADKAAEKSMEAWKGSVVLSTIHRLKGLERKVVFGLGFAEGYKPAPYDTKIPSGLLPHTFSLVEPPNMGVLPGSGKGRVEDERCCAFVLVSRAMERVYLSAPETYQGAVLDPSRFVEELGFSVR
jgi:superfamily I DNA/RNA helicase